MNNKISKLTLFLIFFAMITCAMTSQAEAKYTLRTGSALELGNGYELVARQIDVAAGKVWFELDKNGEFVDDQIFYEFDQATLYGDDGYFDFDITDIFQAQIDALVVIDNLNYIEVYEEIVMDDVIIMDDEVVEEEVPEEEPVYEQVVEEEELPEDALIDVKSTPSGAEVWITYEGDTAYIGDTPIEIPAPVGISFRLEVKMDGYETKSDVITTDTDSIYQVNFELEKEAPEKATVSVKTTPSGAKLWLNNVYWGTTPVEVTIDPGSYNIKLTKDGYVSQTLTQSFSTSESNNIILTLQEKAVEKTPVESSANTADDDTSNNVAPTTKLTNTKRSTESDDDGKITIEIPGFTGISAIVLLGCTCFLLRKRTE